MTGRKPRDHGGGIDAAIEKFGGQRSDWLDLSTGINPQPFSPPPLPDSCWHDLPDSRAFDRLEAAARSFWHVPRDAAFLAAPGASSLIARIPSLLPASAVAIPGPTYNEHQAAFQASGWTLTSGDTSALVIVHPNNPDGRLWTPDQTNRPLTIIDESFCDIAPDRSLIALASRPGTIILKSFGKFWGLAGLRLGFAIGDPALLARLAEALGPWQVSGPALEIGATALEDLSWAKSTRSRLETDAARLDALMQGAGATLLGGTPLFRLYNVDNAAAWQERLATAHLWTRIFPYSQTWLRLGLPGPGDWHRLESAL